jgi:hypothetical protein
MQNAAEGFQISEKAATFGDTPPPVWPEKKKGAPMRHPQFR